MTLTNRNLPSGLRVFVSGAAKTSVGNKGQRLDRVLEFAYALGRALMTDADGPEIILITGGRGLDESADRALVEGAREVLDGQDVAKRIVTFRDPERQDEPMSPVFDGTYVVEMPKGTRQSRRFAMAVASDSIASIAGRVGASEAIALGQAMGRPALPLPFTGGVSAKVWKRGKVGFVEQFDLSADEVMQWEQAMTHENPDLTGFAGNVVRHLRQAAVLPCFVAMPYGDEAAERRYELVIEPAAHAAGFRVSRSDRTLTPGRIPDTMLNQIREAAAAVAVLDDPRYLPPEPSGSASESSAGINPNVMYEVGYAHAMEVPTFLIAEHATTLPFDLAADRTVEAAGLSDQDLEVMLTERLRSIRNAGLSAIGT